MNELGFRALAGDQDNPRQSLVEVVGAERLGIGAAFLSERLDAKEAATLAGAMGAVTNRLGIATSTAHHQIRHPMVVASHCLTMHKLTGGRFSFGLSRAGGAVAGRGAAHANPLQLADFALLLRRLCSGETIRDHDGPAGRFQDLTLDVGAPVRIPLTVDGGDIETLDIGGRVFDSVMLLPYLNEEITRSCVQAVRQSAERSGRNPDQVRVWAALTVVGDQVGDDAQRRKAVGRMAGRLQRAGEQTVGDNGWDRAALKRFQDDIFVRSFTGPIGTGASDSELDHIAELIPAHWLETIAFGTPAQRAERIMQQFDYGVDGVVLQGTSPWEMRRTLDEYRKLRDDERFSTLHVNPAIHRHSLV